MNEERVQEQVQSRGVLVQDKEGNVLADVRSGDELVGLIDLFPGWVVVEVLHLSPQTRGGLVLPSDEAKQQHNLMLFRVVLAGEEKEVDPGKKRPIRFKQGDIVVLKPMMAQAILRSQQEFGVIADVDVIGVAKMQEQLGERQPE
jgi:co-chaperonin GroES (HSP10)